MACPNKHSKPTNISASTVSAAAYYSSWSKCPYAGLQHCQNRFRHRRYHNTPLSSDTNITLPYKQSLPHAGCSCHGGMAVHASTLHCSWCCPPNMHHTRSCCWLKAASALHYTWLGCVGQLCLFPSVFPETLFAQSIDNNDSTAPIEPHCGDFVPDQTSIT